MKEFYSTKEAAIYLGLHKSTLDHWRLKGLGPKWYKSKDGIIRYRKADLDAYMMGVAS